MYYKVVYIHRGEVTENSLFLPGDSSYTITDGVLSLSVGASGSLKLSIPESNPAKAEIRPLTDEIICYRNGAEIFRGRAVSDAEDFYLTGTLLVEGMLSYLCDTQMPPFEHQGSPAQFIQLVLDNHNEHVTDDRKLYLGEVTVLDKNDYIARSATGWQTSLAALTSRLTGSTLSGYLRVRYSGGKRYLDYLSSYGAQAAQEVRLGRNILDIAQDIEYSGVYSAFLPLGKADDETGKRLTIESVNGGSPYLVDDAAVTQYGWIVGTQTWDDVTEAANLKTKGQAAFEQVKSPVANFTVSAIDMAMASADEVAICLGDMVLIQSEPHGLNQFFELTGMELNLLNPAADTLKFGAETASITASTGDSLQNLSEGLNSVAVRINSIVATTITVEYLSAHYATIENLEATTADIENLKAENAEIKNLVAENADLTNADIENLNADVANIKTLLAGSAGVGELQAVHLTAANTVISDALITDAMIASLSAGKLTAGQIITDLIQIMSENGRLLLDGETLQIRDANRVRVQIGRDAAGDYNLALWDAAGNLLWDASGVYAAGLHNGIIRDIAVAEDANISGNKLNIASVAQRLTEDGTLEVTGSQVTVDNTKLDVAYKTITTKTETAQAAADAAQSTANTAKANAATAQSTADTAKANAATAQSTANTAKTNAAAAQSAADQAQADANTAQSTADTAKANAATAQSTADAARANAATAQSTANTAKTNAATAQSTADTAKANAATAQSAAEAAQADADDALEQVGAVTKRTTTLETNLSVVQGQIQSKVWQSDITEVTDPLRGDVTTLQDQYTQVTQDVDSIELNVGNLTTRFDTLAVGGRNLIILSTATEGGRVNQDGTVYSQADHTITDYIPVEAGGNYLLTVWAASAGTQYVALAYYTADKGFIERKMSSSWTAGQTWELPAPETAAYARVSFPTTLAGQIKLEKGTLPTDWTPAPEDTDSAIDSVEAKLELKVDKDKMISELNASADVINLQSNRLVVESDNLSISEDGTLTAVNGTFSGSINATVGHIGTWNITNTGISAAKTVNEQTYQYVIQAPSDYNQIIYSRHRASSDDSWIYDLFITYDGTIACREIVVVSGGSMTVDGNGAFSGSLSTYGFSIPRIQHGSTTVSVTANTATDFSVTFPKAFPGVPTVILTPRHNSDTASINCKVRTVTATGFTGYLCASGGGAWAVGWMALYS